RVRCNDVNASPHDRIAGLRRVREPPRIGDLPAEVQAAHEGEDVAEQRAFGRAERDGKRERRPRRQQLLRPPAAAIRRGQPKNPVDQKPQRRSTEPTVNPAPTDARRTRFPFFSRPAHTASFSASGIVAAVVLPNRSMLMITFSGSIPSFSVADKMIRRLAWGEVKRSRSTGPRPVRWRS